MNIRFGEESATGAATVCPVYSGEPSPYRLRGKSAQASAVTWLLGRTEEEADVLAVGMGARSELTLERIRRAAGISARALMREGYRAARLREPAAAPDSIGAAGISEADWLQAWLEGWLFGLYRFDAFREATRTEGTVDLLLSPGDWQGLSLPELERIAAFARSRNDGVALARDLVNEPPDVLDPQRFTAWAERYFSLMDGPVNVHVYRGEELREKQMNGLIAVGAGGGEPALVEIRYEGDPDQPMLALVGKGVTFDMGGMNVKTGRDISDARMDMGGAAAVAGAMDILIRERAKVNVTALIPIADNLPGSGAMLPSSVIRYPNGLTVQVANTDGEGRLIIADALILAANIGASEAIDIATLTGNVGAALGLGIAGIWGDAGIAKELVAIGERNGERLWPMPLMDEYEAELRSDYADLRNVSSSTMAGAITAALFIRRFVTKPMKWVHIDMAGTVQYKQDAGYAEAGATGYGVRLLADYAVKRAKG
ncbi:M17 family metallopeptidase [Paenibacillus thailandensis]|uniref:Probable cytosol aminopeptidase n=1 Tax=Paenibacillus thailandensis TaxID=393250 RepID=A0ABW5QW40_9BACL